MLLIECFHPVLSLVEDLQGDASEPRAAGDLERRLIDAFEQSEAEAKDAGHVVLKTDAAKFAFTILIDELLMSEEGPLGGDWKDTCNAGAYRTYRGVPYIRQHTMEQVQRRREKTLV